MYRFVDLLLFFHTQFGKTGAQYCNYNLTGMTYLAIWWSEPPLNLTLLPMTYYRLIIYILYTQQVT